MIRFSTQSQAVYWFDDVNNLVMREVGKMGPGMNIENEQWDTVYAHSPIEVGVRVQFALAGDQFRLTTHVVNIEEIP